jgi:hypothetical protein
MTAPPPGFYPDPYGGGGQRYWDGKQWAARTGTSTSTASLARTLVIVLGVALAIGGGCAALIATGGGTHAPTAPTTHTRANLTREDNLFLDAIDKAGLTGRDDDALLVARGQAVCVFLYTGNSRESVRDQLIVEQRLSADKAAAFVSAAVGAYCPDAG